MRRRTLKEPAELEHELLQEAREFTLISIPTAGYISALRCSVISDILS
jgi:hypothetical protein